MKRNTKNTTTTFSVRQLAKIFGKSEDTIRRWKNDGIGSDNTKLVPSQDNTHHLVFSSEAAKEFVKANPYLLDKSPDLRFIMDDDSEINAVSHEHLYISMASVV